MSHESLRRFALEHHGVVTTDQAFVHINRNQLHHLVKTNILRRGGPKVWIFNFAARTWEQRVFAAIASIPAEATLVRLSAARWWGLGRWTRPSIAVAVPRELHGLKREFTLVSSKIPNSQRLIKNGIQVTTVERTIIDLAAVVDRETLRDVIDEMTYRRIGSIARLDLLLEQMPSNTPKLYVVRAELARRSETDRRLMSRFEKEVVHELRAAGFPEPVAQYKVIYGDNTYFPDFCWPDLKIIVEVDGGHHDDPRQMRLDRLRRNQLGSMGYAMQHFGDETNTPTFIRQLLALMRIRAA